MWATGEIDAGPGGPAEDVARRWNRLHPDVPVHVEALPAAADDQRQVMAVELKAGLPALDVLTLDVIWTGEFARNGWLADVQERRSAIAGVALPGAFRSAVWDGKLWAAPFTTDAAFLYYRSDLVRDPPASWGDLVKTGIEVARRTGISPFVGPGAQYEGMVVHYLEYLWSAGGDLFDRSGTKVSFDERPARQALDFMRMGRESGFYAPDFPRMREEEARRAFQAGQAVFMRNWPYAHHLMREEPAVAGSFGIAPLPTFGGRGTVSGLGGSNLAVSRFSQQPQAATEFVTFASTDPEVQRHLAQHHSRAPAMASVYDDLAYDPVMKALQHVLRDAKPRPPSPQWSAISDEIQQQVYPAYTEGRDPGRTVAAIRAFLDRTLAES